jgi:tetratricopeptide (TPR) repeat protein
MLSGKLPLDLTAQSLIEALRNIEQAPPRPLREVWTGAKKLDPDIETIVSKALEKDANDRYGSAAALAEDVRRYLGSQPILARAPSALYQLRKLVRRNPLPAALAASVLVLLVAFAGAMAWQAQRIAAERDRAQAEADKSSAINDFLQATLETANPYAGGDRQVTILDALDRAVARIEKTFTNQPVVEASVRETMGATYCNLGEYEKAEPLLKRAVELRVANQGPNSPDTATSWGQLSRLYHVTGRNDEGIKAAESGIEAQRAADPTDYRLGERLNDLGFSYFAAGKLDEAGKTAREAVAIGRAQPEVTHVFGESLRLLADVLQNEGKPDEAETAMTESLEVDRATLEADNPSINAAKNSLAMILMSKAEYDRAATLLLEVLESDRRQLGENHPEVAVVAENLGNVYFRAGKLDKTIEMLDAAASVRQAAFGARNPLVGRTLCNRGMVLMRLNRLDEAEASMREGVAMMREGLGDHPDVAAVTANLGWFLGQKGDFAGAEAPIREALRIRRTVLGEDNVMTAVSRIDLGLNLLKRGIKTAEARKLVQDGLAVYAPQAAADDARLKSAREALGDSKP